MGRWSKQGKSSGSREPDGGGLQKGTVDERVAPDVMITGWEQLRGGHTEGGYTGRGASGKKSKGQRLVSLSSLPKITVSPKRKIEGGEGKETLKRKARWRRKAAVQLLLKGAPPWGRIFCKEKKRQGKKTSGKTQSGKIGSEKAGDKAKKKKGRQEPFRSLRGV